MVCKANYAVIVTIMLPSCVWLEPPISVMSGTYLLVTWDNIEDMA